ncbi:unnamed protein product [Absidia cylindrospora]
MNNLGLLPTEILSLILGQVEQEDIYTCTFVNQQCHRAAIPLLWRTLFVPDAATAETITSLVESSPSLPGQHVHHLEFGFFEVADTLLLRWMPHLPHLATLTFLSGEKITDTSFQHLPRHCPHLQSLHLRYCPITTLSFRVLGQHCHQLRELHLHECPAIDNTTLSNFVLCPLEKITVGVNHPDHLSHITTMLDLTSYPLLTNLSLACVSASVVKQLLSGVTWPCLTRLTLDTSDHLGDTLAWFIQRHPTLQQLSLIGVDLTDTTLDAISSHLRHVTYVNVSRNHAITHLGIRRMVHQCRSLTFVSLYGCDQTDADFPEAGPACIESAAFHRQEYHRYIHQLDQDAINAIHNSDWGTSLTMDAKMGHGGGIYLEQG